jgi:tetratricopeptide (TPR) repeat protein
MHVMTGNLEDGQALVDKAPSTLLRGLIAIHGGDWTAAKSVLETGLSITRASGARERHADLSFWYARLLRITGQTAQARAFLDDALQIFGEGSLPLVEMWLRPECILALEGKDAAQSHLVRCREILASEEDWRGLAGAVARAEAVVASADNRIQDAETFFERAIATFTRYALPWEQAETLHYWGKALTLAGEHSRATEKFDATIEIYRRHGAGQCWVDRVETDRNTGVSRSGVASDDGTFPPIFRKEGEYWKTAYEGGSANVRERGGMRFIAMLLGRPGENIPAVEMFAAIAAGDVSGLGQDGLTPAGDLGDAGEKFDARALSEYRRRLTEVESEIEAAEASHDSGALARARAEREMLSQEIASGTGLYGGLRRAASHHERARVNVTRQIKSAIDAIQKVNLPLGRHLANSIYTGSSCRYAPADRIKWQL